MVNRIFFFSLLWFCLIRLSDTITIQLYMTESSQKRKTEFFCGPSRFYLMFFWFNYHTIVFSAMEISQKLKTESFYRSHEILPYWVLHTIVSILQKRVKKGKKEPFSGLLKFFLIFHWHNYHSILFFYDFEKSKTELFFRSLKFYFIRLYCTTRISVIYIYNLTFYTFCYRISKLP